MPATVKSLKKENDQLREQINVLTKEFKNLEQTLQGEAMTTDDGRQATSTEKPPSNLQATSAETQRNLEFYSNSYDDLNRFRMNAVEELKRLGSRLNDFTAQVEEIANAIKETQRYSYQYNVKIIGIPERDSRESALETTTLCISLFNALGVEVSHQDIDIAHRVPSRNALFSMTSPIIFLYLLLTTVNQRQK